MVIIATCKTQQASERAMNGKVRKMCDFGDIGTSELDKGVSTMHTPKLTQFSHLFLVFPMLVNLPPS